MKKAYMFVDKGDEVSIAKGYKVYKNAKDACMEAARCLKEIVTSRYFTPCDDEDIEMQHSSVEKLQKKYFKTKELNHVGAAVEFFDLAVWCIELH